MKNKPEERLIQAFPHRCPYCDRRVSYDYNNLKKGENRIECPSCKKIYIKMVWDSFEGRVTK